MDTHQLFVPEPRRQSYTKAAQRDCSGTVGLAKNPPKGKFIEGVFYVAATLWGLRARSRDPQSDRTLYAPP